MKNTFSELLIRIVIFIISILVFFSFGVLFITSIELINKLVGILTLDMGFIRVTVYLFLIFFTVPLYIVYPAYIWVLRWLLGITNNNYGSISGTWLIFVFGLALIFYLLKLLDKYKLTSAQNDNLYINNNKTAIEATMNENDKTSHFKEITKLAFYICYLLFTSAMIHSFFFSYVSRFKFDGSFIVWLLITLTIMVFYVKKKFNKD